MKSPCNFWLLSFSEGIFRRRMTRATRTTVIHIHGTLFAESVMVLFFLEIVLS